MVIKPFTVIDFSQELKTLKQADHHAAIPLLGSEEIAAQASHIQIRTLRPLILKLLFHPHQQGRLAHLTSVEHITKFTRLQCLIQIPVCLPHDIGRRIRLQASTDFIAKRVHRALCVK